MARFCIASAPYLPWPTKVSGGLWYTEASVEISSRSWSKSAGGRDCMVFVIGGFSDKTIFCATAESKLRGMDDGRTRGTRSHLCHLRIAGQQSPVHVSSISNVRIVVPCRCRLQDSLHERLRLIRLLQEELDDRRQDLQLCLDEVGRSVDRSMAPRGRRILCKGTHLRKLLGESFDEAVQDVLRV